MMNMFKACKDLSFKKIIDVMCFGLRLKFMSHFRTLLLTLLLFFSFSKNIFLFDIIAAREAQSDEEAIRLIMLMKAREKVMSGEIDELTPDTKFIFGDEDSDLDAFEYYVSDSDRYAAIENWSDRAYQILLDLGLVEESDI